MTGRKERNKEKKADNRSKRGVYAMLVFICAAMLFFVGINAHSSTIQYEINSLNKEIQETNRQLQTLEVKIKSSSNIANVETKALAMGLIHPEYDQIVHLNGPEEAIEEFALALMESVYVK